MRMRIEKKELREMMMNIEGKLVKMMLRDWMMMERIMRRRKMLRREMRIEVWKSEWNISIVEEKGKFKRILNNGKVGRENLGGMGFVRKKMKLKDVEREEDERCKREKIKRIENDMKGIESEENEIRKKIYIRNKWWIRNERRRFGLWWKSNFWGRMLRKEVGKKVNEFWRIMIGWRFGRINKGKIRRRKLWKIVERYIKRYIKRRIKGGMKWNDRRIEISLWRFKERKIKEGKFLIIERKLWWRIIN